MKTMLTGLDAAELARLAWERHLETCRECAYGLEYCPAGHKYLAATQPDRSWIPDYPDGA